MDVLNTYGGGTDTVLIVLGVIMCIVGLTVLIAGFAAVETPPLVLGGLMMLVGLFAIASANSPVRHEVTLRPGHVIDAAKYEVIDQRGAIYVIEEREVSE
ncbi:hypothetical protein [Paenibacillus sp. TC-CSREp1]|uniref:hypothetical protein n=1 Tax=Paenibacillus sp. TC-CSREp1 TaxID=3410089 RepID=UPI003CE9271E